MGLGPAICNECYIVLEYSKIRKQVICPRCGQTDLRLKSNLFELTISDGDLIERRTDFFKSIPSYMKMFKINNVYSHVLYRPFMTMDLEPNDYYRPWLESNVGRQGIHWQWDLASDFECIEIFFMKKEDAILFELKWP